MKPEHVPIPRHRSATGPAILSMGFRPFFLLAGLWAAAGLALSIVAMLGPVTLPTAFDPVTWHLHEMLFGYVAATLTGFLLTAIPNWTGNLPLQGPPLAGLALLWIAGRAAIATSAVIGAEAAAVVDTAFLAAVVALTGREVIAGRNWRNLPVIVAVCLFLAGNMLVHAEAYGAIDAGGAGGRLSIAVIVALIALVGGRITPSFTRNWLVKRGENDLPASFGGLDKVALATTVAALALWIVLPDSNVTAASIALAACATAVRLARWRGHATGAEALVWVLHLGYAWVPVGLGLLALSHWWEALPQSAALHALTVGAVGTMTLAVMSRATMGHTGRDLHAGPALTIAYPLVSVAALARIASALWADAMLPLLWLAAAAWIAAFAIYLVVCGPMLLFRKPASDEN